MTNRKVAIFPPSLQGGGVQRVALNLVFGFLEAGYDVDLVLIKADPAHAHLIPAGANVIDLGAKRALTSLPALVRYLRRAKPDMLIGASEPVNLVSIWARWLARTHTPITALILNTPSRYQANILRRRERLYPLLARRFYPAADWRIANSEGARQDAIAYYGLPSESVHAIVSPVIGGDFYARADAPADHPWLHDDDPRPLLLAVARFVPAKDLHTLIRAFAQVRAERPARLLILGDGPQRPELETLINELGVADDVSLPGFQPNLPYMKACDVFVLSSIFEGLPTVLIEALALAPAVVSTDCPSGPREILQGGEIGHLVPMQDPAALAQAILATLQDPPPTEALRARAEAFSIETVIDAYLRLFGWRD